MVSVEVRHELPANFFSLTAKDLSAEFSGPTLIHLKGQRAPALFVSILLHGNEDVGLQAIQKALSSLDHTPLTRELMLFIGNPIAAQSGLRKLAEQEDFNRVWPGTDSPRSEIQQCMHSVYEYARQRGLFLSLDLHNNTGTNPLYGCINHIDAQTLHLATLFSRTVIFFRRPLGVQSAAMAKLCPALTCECGKVGDPAGVQRAADLIHACLHLHELPAHYPPASDFHLLRNIARIKIPHGSTVTFDGQDPSADLLFRSELDHWNFRPLPVGTLFCQRRMGSHARLCVLDDHDHDIESTFFSVQDESIFLRRPVIPSMLTTNLQIIHDDCLGYFMEEMQLETTA